MAGRPALGEIAQMAQTSVFAITRSTYGAWVPAARAGPLPVSKFPRNDITNGRTRRSTASVASDRSSRWHPIAVGEERK
jgi:hypothetical protein